MIDMIGMIRNAHDRCDRRLSTSNVTRVISYYIVALLHDIMTN